MSSHFERQLVVPDGQISLRNGALAPAPWSSNNSRYFIQALESLAKQFNFSIDVPFNDLDEDVQSIILYGSGTLPVVMEFDDGMRSYSTKKPFEGVIPNLARRYRETDSSWTREELEKFRANQPCESCDGKRLKAEALAVKIDKCDISDVARLSIADARQWFADLATKLQGQESEIAARILKEINERLGFLVNVGLGYLAMSRSLTKVASNRLLSR